MSDKIVDIMSPKISGGNFWSERGIRIPQKIVYALYTRHFPATFQVVVGGSSYIPLCRIPATVAKPAKKNAHEGGVIFQASAIPENKHWGFEKERDGLAAESESADEAKFLARDSELEDKLNEISGYIDEWQLQRAQAIEELSSRREQCQKLKTDLNEFKEALGDSSDQTADASIHLIELQLQAAKTRQERREEAER